MAAIVISKQVTASLIKICVISSGLDTAEQLILIACPTLCLIKEADKHITACIQLELDQSVCLYANSFWKKIAVMLYRVA